MDNRGDTYFRICPSCRYEVGHHNLIDPAELKGLIEEVLPLEGEVDLFAPILEYLSGDPEPLRKLAGEK
jgi:hypothetical protein